MLFLLNDRVLDLVQAEMSLAAAAHRYRRLSLDDVAGLGAEVFSEDPLAHAGDPARALRLATMIVAVAPRINAAQFLAPEIGCPPADVERRFERVSLALLDELDRVQDTGRPIAWIADRRLWRRLAA